MDTIKQGDKGEAVSKLQNLLKALGVFQGTVDGSFGPRTKAFVVQLQKASGLAPDGMVGPKTWEVLLEKTSPPKPQSSLAVYRYVGSNTANQDRAATIDDETALWCARMCVGEGGQKCSAQKAAAMLWAIMNRWMLHPGRKSWPTYLYLLRRFSQPINPRWQKGGDLAEKYAGTESGSPARLKRRAQICALEWSDVPDTISKTVKAFQRGTLPPPEALRTLEHPRISNWASHKGLSKKYPWGIAFEKSKQPDWFFEDAKLIKGSVVVDYLGA
jgi:peptidoglycan hydrolase-like protein with peptidoglycan-binding domain